MSLQPFSDSQLALRMQALLDATKASGRRQKGHSVGPLSIADRRALEAYLSAHRRVLDARAEARAEWLVDLQFLKLDTEYQRLRARVKYTSGLAPGLRHLSGPRSPATKLHALGLLVRLLKTQGGGRTAKASPEFSRAAARLLKWSRRAEFQRILKLQDLRARSLGPAMVAFHAFSQASLPNAVLSDAGSTAAAGAQNADDWVANVVRIERNGSFAGTGFFVTNSLIVTAAHVARKEGTPEPVAGEFVVGLPDGQSSQVLAVNLNPDWKPARLTLDACALAVPSAAGLGLPVIWDFGKDGPVEVSRWGFPAGGEEPFGSGTVERAGGTFVTKDPTLQIPAGSSGCPLLHERQGVVHAVGIGTARTLVSTTTPTFIGVPLLHQLLPEL